MRADLFGRLPRPTTVLLLSSVFELSSAHVLHAFPRQTQAPTKTIPYHDLNVVSWPLLPTPPPADLFALDRRQENTICGYISGDPALPATCSAGSHCALDTENNVVGCCPDGDVACTAGVFTGCVDANSGPQTEVNPYVFTCLDGAVCYRNIFDGGFSQFGCGTASDQAATVVATANGITLTRPTVTVSYSQGISTLSEPTTLGTITSTRTSTSSASSRALASSSPSASSSTDVTGTAETSPALPTAAPTAASRTGAIVGGTIGGLAVLIALIALAFFFLRRRNANVRQGPGPGGIHTKSIGPPEGGTGTGFVALAQDSEAFETGPGPAYDPQPSLNPNPNPNPMTMNMAMGRGAGTGTLPPLATIPIPPMPFQNDVSPGDDYQMSPYTYGGAASAGAATSHSSYPPTTAGSSDTATGGSAGYLYPGPQQQYPAAYVGGGMRQFESDQVPLTREIDDFSQGFSAALGRIGEEDEDGVEGGHIPAPASTATAAAAGTNLADPHQSVGSGRPLWQQNRRQSRNLMWM
ncbi:hypothetical protein MMYC01_209459 [Madurella mycetomatis]|uniref:Uncharacterized protein n=1 Tax=Madurella mycetomatis TaxID=100816 RepID=A0A175VTT9_9PEZI|nr:hypothetical protein MMYC01_209459 [Madurella mycetomatis]